MTAIHHIADDLLYVLARPYHTCIVRNRDDSQDAGAEFFWLRGSLGWTVQDRNRGADGFQRHIGNAERLAVVTLGGETEPDFTDMDNACLAMDQSAGINGEWVIGTNMLNHLRRIYPDIIEVVWTQP